MGRSMAPNVPWEKRPFDPDAVRAAQALADPALQDDGPLNRDVAYNVPHAVR